MHRSIVVSVSSVQLAITTMQGQRESMALEHSTSEEPCNFNDIGINCQG